MVLIMIHIITHLSPISTASLFKPSAKKAFQNPNRLCCNVRCAWVMLIPTIQKTVNSVIKWLFAGLSIKTLSLSLYLYQCQYFTIFCIVHYVNWIPSPSGTVWVLLKRRCCCSGLPGSQKCVMASLSCHSELFDVIASEEPDNLLMPPLEWQCLCSVLLEMRLSSGGRKGGKKNNNPKSLCSILALKSSST